MVLPNCAGRNSHPAEQNVAEPQRLWFLILLQLLHILLQILHNESYSKDERFGGHFS